MTPALLLAALLAAPWPAFAQVRTDTSFAVGASGTIRIETHHGNVRVRGADERRVRVQASHPSRVDVDIRMSGNMLRVDAENPRGLARDVDYDIVVPRGWGVRVDGHDLPIVIENTGGDVVASNFAGDLIVSDVASARLETVNGVVMLRGARGDVRVETVNDGARISDVVGNVTVEGVNGSIGLAGIDGATVKATTVNGRVQFQGRIREGGDYAFATHNGDVTVTVPGDASASVTVATHQGSVEADFPVSVRGDISRRGELQFRIGAGSATLRVESFSGAIRILRADGRTR